MVGWFELFFFLERGGVCVCGALNTAVVFRSGIFHVASSVDAVLVVGAIAGAIVGAIVGTWAGMSMAEAVLVEA